MSVFLGVKLPDYVHIKEKLFILMYFQDPEIEVTIYAPTIEVTIKGSLFSVSHKKMLSQAVGTTLGQAPWSQRVEQCLPRLLCHNTPQSLAAWETDYIWGWNMSVNHQSQELPLKTSGFFSRVIF